eukprot:TRINITY_DN10330_c0_g1_i1.p1 TRINITY_DN10330_c0_g1~~TRINITY_DN10330_c0_g1_i1.p1  ORF type:complete len:120 (-),score=33.59 TRINITY_DN10330_c0_g1_i1:213-572(-)
MHLYFIDKAKESSTINKAIGTIFAVSGAIFVFLIIIAYSIKPNQPTTPGAEAILIGILVSKLVTLGIVIYQKLFRDRNFVVEILDFSNSTALSYALKVIYILFLMYRLPLIVEECSSSL